MLFRTCKAVLLNKSTHLVLRNRKNYGHLSFWGFLHRIGPLLHFSVTTQGEWDSPFYWQETEARKCHFFRMAEPESHSSICLSLGAMLFAPQWGRTIWSVLHTVWEPFWENWAGFSQESVPLICVNVSWQIQVKITPFINYSAKGKCQIFIFLF